jgi:hypothetical protein
LFLLTSDACPREENALNAYVLIQTQRPGGTLAEALLGIPGVFSAEDVSGAYDAIALTRTDSTRQLVEDVIAAIERLPGVSRALPAPWAGGDPFAGGLSPSTSASDPRAA